MAPPLDGEEDGRRRAHDEDEIAHPPLVPGDERARDGEELVREGVEIEGREARVVVVRGVERADAHHHRHEEHERGGRKAEGVRAKRSPREEREEDQRPRGHERDEVVREVEEREPSARRQEAAEGGLFAEAIERGEDGEEDREADDVREEPPEEHPPQAERRDEHRRPPRDAEVVGELRGGHREEEERGGDNDPRREPDVDEEPEAGDEEVEELIRVAEVQLVQVRREERRVPPVPEHSRHRFVKRQIGHRRVVREEDREPRDAAGDPGGELLRARPRTRNHAGR